MRLRNVTFENWLKSHGHKDPEERWLRELYPWPVLAQVDCDQELVGQPQQISYDGVEYEVTLDGIEWQLSHGTYKYRLTVDSEGLGWHARSWSDKFNMCGAPDGTFVTLFHAGKKEPLEKIARAFFARKWENLSVNSFHTLGVSRFLAASLVAETVTQVFEKNELSHYPNSRIAGGFMPMFANDQGFWVGYRFFSEDAFSWARKNAAETSSLIAVYFADTKHQFRTDLPPNAKVISLPALDATQLGGHYRDLILALLHRLTLPAVPCSLEHMNAILRGKREAPPTTMTEGDVHEALAALKRPCDSKAELRYQLSAGVLLNEWIERERKLGFSQRKKFYAFKKRIDELVRWAAGAKLPGVRLWSEDFGAGKGPVLFVRVDDVDFSFHSIPSAKSFVGPKYQKAIWNGVRLKPISPLVLAWSRSLLEDGR